MQRVPVAVVTAGAAGALLYVNGERYEVRPRRTREVDATGAGDVFAATFLIHYDRDGDPWEAAEAATCAASLSVEGEGWSAVPDAAGSARCSTPTARAEARVRILDFEGATCQTGSLDPAWRVVCRIP